MWTDVVNDPNNTLREQKRIFRSAHNSNRMWRRYGRAAAAYGIATRDLNATMDDVTDYKPEARATTYLQLLQNKNFRKAAKVAFGRHNYARLSSMLLNRPPVRLTTVTYGPGQVLSNSVSIQPDELINTNYQGLSSTADGYKYYDLRLNHDGTLDLGMQPANKGNYYKYKFERDGAGAVKFSVLFPVLGNIYLDRTLNGWQAYRSLSNNNYRPTPLTALEINYLKLILQGVQPDHIKSK